MLTAQKNTSKTVLEAKPKLGLLTRPWADEAEATQCEAEATESEAEASHHEAKVEDTN